MREDWFCPSPNFGALPPNLSRVDTSRIVLLPVPFESSTTYRAGCRHGPGAIVEASTNMELFDEELRGEPCRAGIHTSLPLDIVDDSETMIERINAVAFDYLRKDKFVTVLGGEHTVSLGLIRALNRVHRNLSVIFIDAHADFRDTYHGNKYNHGCVARRAAEICGIVQVGVRSLSAEEARALRRGKVKTFWAHEFASRRGTQNDTTLIDRIVENLGPNVHISIDADGFDPSVMPAVGTPEPGGLLWEEVLSLLRTVVREKNVVGLDFVELAPIPGLVYPEFTAARLLYKIWGYLLNTQ